MKKPNVGYLISLGLAVALVCSWTTPVFPQETAKKPTIKHEVAKQTPANSGATMYHEYCAACHGIRADGNGPAAPALKVAPPNLTTLAKRNGGTFPVKHVEDVLNHGISVPAHGNSEMPVWGPTFRALGSDSQIVTLRVANLREYLKSLQQQ